MVQEKKVISGEAKRTRTHQNFQETFRKNTGFSRKTYHKNRLKFPGELSQNCARTHTIFQDEKIL